MKLLPSRFKRTPKDVQQLETKVEDLQEVPIHRMSQEEIDVWEAYLERICTDKEKKLVALHETDPTVYGNKIRSYIIAYDKNQDVEVGSNEYHKYGTQATKIWQHERVQAYKKLLQFKYGNDLNGAIALSNTRLMTYIEQFDDPELSLKAIKELNRVMKLTSDDVNVQVNSQTNVRNSGVQDFDLTKLSTDELSTFVKLLDKVTPQDD